MQGMANRITSADKAMRGTSIGDRLRQVREDLGLSQPQMAEALGMPFGTYQAYEQDRSAQKASMLARLAERGIDLNWLLTGRGPMHVSSRPSGLSEAPVRYGEHPPNGIRFNEELLKVVVSEIERALEEARGKLGPEKKAELVVAVYVLALEQEEAGRPIDRANVLRLVRLAG